MVSPASVDRARAVAQRGVAELTEVLSLRQVPVTAASWVAPLAPRGAPVVLFDLSRKVRSRDNQRERWRPADRRVLRSLYGPTPGRDPRHGATIGINAGIATTTARAPDRMPTFPDFCRAGPTPAFRSASPPDKTSRYPCMSHSIESPRFEPTTKEPARFSTANHSRILPSTTYTGKVSPIGDTVMIFVGGRRER
jgi:hypothetical protein